MTNDATQAQIAAADPAFSTWLSANAGSGKTRVLIDRVARLLLNGTEPQNILCLTYTKAAATEMQNRLFDRLGKWAMLDDKALCDELIQLGETPPASLSHARTLFARAVEAPGGLKIQTIHSFCSAILRQFPLEAGISPQFRELDEAGQTALTDSVLDTLARDGDPALAEVALYVSDDTLTGLALSVSRNRDRFEQRLSRAQIYALFQTPPDETATSIIHETITTDDLAFLKDCGRCIAQSNSTNDGRLADNLLALPDTPGEAAFSSLCAILLTQERTKAPFSSKSGSQPTKDFRNGPFQPFLDRFKAISDRVQDARDRYANLQTAHRTAALHGFAQSFLPAYAAAKETAGVLDFDDLIQKASRLLTTRSLEWVLYRLDSRIEHILIDEAQDTSPPQWDVIDALTREILSGETDRQRTIFVVGDKKQSIYSFQGADAEAYEAMRNTFVSRDSNAPSLEPRELLYSFRSSSAILATVDQVFDGDAGKGLGASPRHRAFHETLPGRVDLWPLIPAPDENETAPWYDPVDRVAADDPKILLAEKIAQRIKAMIGTVTIPGEKGIPRSVRAGDFLILVQGRGLLFDQIIRACKGLDLPIAGADRLKIGGELAVKDLLALLSFLALPEDNLSLAAALRSPLFGWSERQLYDLAQGRDAPILWAEMRRRQADFPDTFRALGALRGQVDFLRPYELLEYILTRQDGRRKLLGRLGPEAEDGIDELLNQALAFESDAVPSLTACLSRAQSEEIEIKRQSDASGNMIRVMTVHGAKGLESPIVILPDTTRKKKTSNDPVLPDRHGRPVWSMSRTEAPRALIPAIEARSDAEEQERQRLLYVAMTRAETWLIVCGTENSANKKNTWHGTVKEGMAGKGAQSVETPTGPGLRMSHGTWPETAQLDAGEDVTKQGDLPGFLALAAAPPAPPPAVRAPSDLGGDKTAGGGAKAEEAALRYGRQVHRLLEFLPSTRGDIDTAHRLLASGPDPADEDETINLHAAVTACLSAHPRIFGPDTLAEVDIAALLPTPGIRISGTIDRLLIETGQVTAVDFKTNAVVPDTPEDVPEGILRQMGAYLEALEQVFPDQRVTLLVLWTATASLMEIPHDIARAALARTTTS